MLADPKNHREFVVQTDIFLEAVQKLSGSFELFEKSSGS